MEPQICLTGADGEHQLMVRHRVVEVHFSQMMEEWEHANIRKGYSVITHRLSEEQLGKVSWIERQPSFKIWRVVLLSFVFLGVLSVVVRITSAPNTWNLEMTNNQQVAPGNACIESRGGLATNLPSIQKKSVVPTIRKPDEQARNPNAPTPDRRGASPQHPASGLK